MINEILHKRTDILFHRLLTIIFIAALLTSCSNTTTKPAITALPTITPAVMPTASPTNAPTAISLRGEGDVENMDEMNYIGNVNSKKFHKKSCSTLPNKKNRVYFKTRDEAIAAKFVPCKRCIGK